MVQSLFPLVTAVELLRTCLAKMVAIWKGAGWLFRYVRTTVFNVLIPLDGYKRRGFKDILGMGVISKHLKVAEDFFYS